MKPRTESTSLALDSLAPAGSEIQTTLEIGVNAATSTDVMGGARDGSLNVEANAPERSGHPFFVAGTE